MAAVALVLVSTVAGIGQGLLLAAFLPLAASGWLARWAQVEPTRAQQWLGTGIGGAFGFLFGLVMASLLLKHFASKEA